MKSLPVQSQIVRLNGNDNDWQFNVDQLIEVGIKLTNLSSTIHKIKLANLSSTIHKHFQIYSSH